MHLLAFLALGAALSLNSLPSYEKQSGCGPEKRDARRNSVTLEDLRQLCGESVVTAALVVGNGGTGPAIDANGMPHLLSNGPSRSFHRQRVQRPLLATRATARCAIAVRPNWVGCNGSLAFFIIMNDLGSIVARCPCGIVMSTVYNG